MSRFQFKFESVLQFRRSRRDLCRQRLAQVLGIAAQLDGERSRLLDARDQLLAELRGLSDEGEVDVDGSASRRYRAGQLAIDIALVDQQRELASQELRRCRQALVEADQQVKSFEKLSDKQRDEYRQQQERRERLELEETWAAGRAAGGSA